VVAFSGHGSSTHALVPYDADRAHPDETFLPLDELAQLLNQVRASTLVCVLDCCFSGGFDAKVYTTPLEARGLESEAELLEQIAGKGRIVLTASAANEPAYEVSIHRGCDRRHCPNNRALRDRVPGQCGPRRSGKSGAGSRRDRRMAGTRPIGPLGVGAWHMRPGR
jgi:hypothetical protein